MYQMEMSQTQILSASDAAAVKLQFEMEPGKIFWVFIKFFYAYINDK